MRYVHTCTGSCDNSSRFFSHGTENVSFPVLVAPPNGNLFWVSVPLSKRGQRTKNGLKRAHGTWNFASHFKYNKILKVQSALQVLFYFCCSCCRFSLEDLYLTWPFSSFCVKCVMNGQRDPYVTTMSRTFLNLTHPWSSVCHDHQQNGHKTEKLQTAWGRHHWNKREREK